MARSVAKKEPVCRIVAILDRSGSMEGLAQDVIGSYNEFIKQQQAVPGDATVTLVLFDDKYEVVYQDCPLPEVEALDRTTYFVRGWTAMNDAICKAVRSIPASEEKVIVLIQTDGYENASREYTNEDVKKLVKECEAKGWEFQFMGANIDTMQEGTLRGFNPHNTMSFDASPEGVKMSGQHMSYSTSNYRSSPPVEIDDKNTLTSSGDLS